MSAQEALADDYTGIVPDYAWLGDVYTPVFRVYVDGHLAGTWAKERWAKRDLREQLRDARRAAGRSER